MHLLLRLLIVSTSAENVSAKFANENLSAMGFTNTEAAMQRLDTFPGGLPLVFFGAYLWTSCAGDLLPVEGGNQARLCANSGNESKFEQNMYNSDNHKSKKGSKPCVSQPDLIEGGCFSRIYGTYNDLLR